MKATFTLGLFALALLASPAFAEEEAKTGVKWVETYEKALETAKAEKKRVFIEFTATWWGPCKSLARDVWPSEELAKVIAKNFVPVMVYQDIEKEKTAPILKKYAIRAFPTFVITDAEGVEQSRKVGSPFSTPAEAIAWFPKLEDALTNLAAYEAAHKEKPEDVDAGLKLAGAYQTLDKAKEALELYETFGAKLTKDDKRFVDVQMDRAKLLLGTINKENQDEVLAKIADIHATFLPDLVKATDERAISPSILNARIKAAQKKAADGRTELQALAKAFEKSSRLTEIKFWSAQLAAEAGEKEVAKAELQAIIDAGPADSNWVKSAKSSLDRLNKASN